MKKKEFYECVNVFNDPERDAARITANCELISILAQYITEHPHQRFGQALRNLGIVFDNINVDGSSASYANAWSNEFYTESSDMLENVKRTIKAANEVRSGE